MCRLHFLKSLHWKWRSFVGLLFVRQDNESVRYSQNRSERWSWQKGARSWCFPYLPTCQANGSSDVRWRKSWGWGRGVLYVQDLLLFARQWFLSVSFFYKSRKCKSWGRSLIPVGAICLDKPFPAVSDWKPCTSSITLLNCCLVWPCAIKRWPCLTPVVGELKPSAQSYYMSSVGGLRTVFTFCFYRIVQRGGERGLNPSSVALQNCTCSNSVHLYAASSTSPLPRRAPPPAPVKQLRSIWSSSCQSLPRYTWMISSLCAQASIKNKTQIVRLGV